MMNVGSQGRLLRIGEYTVDGSYTWYLQDDVGFIVVEAVGAGGGNRAIGSGTNGSSGGSSSFGSHVTSGGGGGATSSDGSGGAGSGSADFWVDGQSGLYGGLTYEFTIGRGGLKLSGTYYGGGGGGYSRKMIQRSSLGSTESVTVGNGGAAGSSGNEAGRDGMIRVYEYSL